MTSVSVIIPVYNVSKYIRQCLDSVVNQTLKNIEIICVDDCSTDNSLDILKCYADVDNRILIMKKQKNSGYGHSMNVAFSKASGEYIGIVEGDDFIELDAFENLYLMAKSGSYDIVGSDYFVENINLNYTKIIQRINVDDLICLKSERVLNRTPIWSSIYKRSFLEDKKIKLQETPGASYQDLPFVIETWLETNNVSFVSKPFIHYRIDNPNSSMNSKEKSFCIFDCFDEIYSHFIERNQMNDELGRIFFKLEYHEYKANYLRVSDVHKCAMISEMADRLKKSYLNFERFDYFNSVEREDCKLIIDEPIVYLERTLAQNKLYKEWYSRCDHIVIYGSGTYALNEYQRIISYGYADKVLCFAESKDPCSKSKYGKSLLNIADCIVNIPTTIVILAVNPKSDYYYSMVENVKKMSVCNLIDVNGQIIE